MWLGSDHRGSVDRDRFSADLGFTALQVAVGLMMAFGHGLAKVPPAAGFVEAVGSLGFRSPAVFAWAAGLSEFVGGLLIVAGLFTRPASLFLAVSMGVALFLKHGADPIFSREGPSKELAMLKRIARSMALPQRSSS